MTSTRTPSPRSTSLNSAVTMQAKLFKSHSPSIQTISTDRQLTLRRASSTRPTAAIWLHAAISGVFLCSECCRVFFVWLVYVLSEDACVNPAEGHVDSQSLDATVSVDCNYFFVFKNKAHAEHDYAANCVPAAVCKDDVVGMTKGLVGTYGVVLQILQGNLGSLYWLGEGQLNECYKAMHQINTGKIEDLFVTKPGLVIAGHVLTHDTVMEIPGMTKLGVKESLSSCKDDGSVGYLFVHKNLYWSNKKDEVDLGEFTKFKQAHALQRMLRKCV